MIASLGRTRLLARLRRGCAAAVLVELRTRAATQPDRLWTVRELAGLVSYQAGTVRDSLGLAVAAGVVRTTSIPGRYPPVPGYTLTDEGRAFAATIRVGQP